MPVSITSHQYAVTEHGALELFVYRDGSSLGARLRPGIVFFFGGGWAHGTPEHFSTQAKYLAERGMVAICADYRVMSRHGVYPDTCVADALAALRWVHSHHAQLGIDPARIVAAGGSAGGHLAAFAAVMCSAQDRCAPSALVLFNPVLDTTGPERVARRFGGDLAMARRLSPNHHLRPGLPPTLVFHGTADQTVSIEQARTFAREMTQLGNSVELFEAPDQGHGFFNRSPWLERTLSRTDEYLASLDYLQGAPNLQMTEE
jgi:acetyl esterase/lipase